MITRPTPPACLPSRLHRDRSVTAFWRPPGRNRPAPPWGKEADELCLRIYLACKLPLDQIPAERRVPPTVADCVRAEASEALQRDFARLDLTRPGVSGKTVAMVLGLD